MMGVCWRGEGERDGEGGGEDGCVVWVLGEYILGTVVCDVELHYIIAFGRGAGTEVEAHDLVDGGGVFGEEGGWLLFGD